MLQSSVCSKNQMAWFRRLVRFVCAALLSLALWSASDGMMAAAAGTPIIIKAEDQGHFDLRESKLTLQGDVLLSVDDWEIEAERVAIDLQRDELVGTGSVVLRRDLEVVSGDTIRMNLRTEEVWLYQPRGAYQNEQLKEPVYLLGQELEVKDAVYHVTDGRLTTCDRDEPCYYIGVREAHLYPGDRLVLRGLVYYEGRIPLFFFPAMVIPLRPGRDGTDLRLPAIGYSQQDGWYIKNTISYYINRYHYGAVYLDYYTQAGFAGGFRHLYQLGEEGGGGLVSLYAMPRPDHWDVRTKFNYAVEKDLWSLTAAGEYFDELPSEDRDGQADVSFSQNFQDEGLQFSSEGRYQLNPGANTGERWNVSGKWQQDVSENLRLTLDGGFIHQEYAQLVRTVNYSGALGYRSGDHSLSLEVQQRYNPDLLDEEERPNWSSFNRIPELAWQWRNPTLADWRFPGRLGLTAGYYREFPSRAEGMRALSSLDLSTQTLRLSSDTSLSYRGGIEVMAYETMQQSALSYRLTLNQSLGTALRLTGTYSHRTVVGTTPFRFDRRQPESRLTGRLTWRFDGGSLSLRTGYDFEKETYDRVVQNLRVTRNDINVRLDTYYDLNQQRWGTLVPRVDYTADALELSWTARYDLAERDLERMEGRIAFDLGDGFRVSYDALYHFGQERFTRGQVMMTWDLHCRELRLRYDHVQEEIWLELQINAFPDVPLRMSGDEPVASLLDMTDINAILGIEDEPR